MALRGHGMPKLDAYLQGYTPSVTEVLQLAGFIDFSMVPSSVLEAKMQLGKEVHSWTEAMDAGQLEPARNAPALLRGYLNAYAAFRKEVDCELQSSEMKVSNERYRYDGTLDRIFILRGARALVDIKTVATLTPVIGLQLAGYEMCLEGSHNRYALQLKSDGRYKLEPYKKRSDRHDFLAATRVAHYRLSNGLVAEEELT